MYIYIYIHCKNDTRTFQCQVIIKPVTVCHLSTVKSGLPLVKWYQMHLLQLQHILWLCRGSASVLVAKECVMYQAGILQFHVVQFRLFMLK